MAERNYSYKDVDMLLTAQTILQNLENNLDELSPIRTNWTPEFVNQLQTQVDEAMSTYLGLDKKKQLKEATQAIYNLQEPALKDLLSFKTQLKVDFPQEANEYLTTLGFTKDPEKVQNKNQEALIELLYTFKTQMTDELKTTLTSKGMKTELIDSIIAYADAIKEANITQETLKQSSKELSEEAVAAFNNIYTQVIGICKIATTHYTKNDVQYNQFVFSKIVKNLSAGS